MLFTVYEMKRLGRDAAELTALADHLTAHGLVLEMPAGPLPGIYDPSGPGRMLFGFFTAMAETERESIREATLEGLDAAARKGKYGGRPPVITDDMLQTVLRRKAAGESVEQIRPDLNHPHWQAQGAEPRPGQRLPRARRTREGRGISGSRQASPRRLHYPHPVLSLEVTDNHSLVLVGWRQPYENTAGKAAGPRDTAALHLRTVDQIDEELVLYGHAETVLIISGAHESEARSASH